MDAIPFNATRPEHVVPIYRFASVSVPAFGGRLAWSANLEAVLAAAGNATSGSASAAAAADPADVFLRLRYCPGIIQPVQDSNGTAVPNPFIWSDNGGSSSVLQQGDGGGDGGDEREAAAGDGGEGGGPCDAPVPLPGSASAAQCAAARRLLQCSESLVFLTELKDARLAPANVSSEVLPAGSLAQRAQQAGGEAASREALGGSPDWAVRLSSDAVALFVSVEAEGRPGRFNGSALLLLPWQPQALLFFPTVQAGTGGTSSAGGTPQAEPAGPAGTAASSSPAAEHAPAAEQGGAADPTAAAPSLNVYWLQQALSELQPEVKAEAASSAGARAAWLAALPLLAALALLGASAL